MGGPVNTNPSEAQREAGNYQKGHMRLHGLDISIENPRGSTRSGTDKGGHPWSVQVPDHYGYIRRTEGRDGDHVDVYVGPDGEQSQHAFVINQINPDTGKFDEHKVMLGYPHQKAATDAYRRSFSDGSAYKRLGSVVPMHIGQFKDWLKDGDTRTPAKVTES